MAVIECPPDHPALPGLYDPDVPNSPALWAVFLGMHTGRAVVDNTRQPTQCVLRTDARLTYASRQISQEFLLSAIGYLRHTGAIWLINAQADLPAPKGYSILPRLEFRDYDPHSRQLASLRSLLPEGSRLQRIDRGLLERCAWREDMEFYCGSLDNFLRNDLGLCMMNGEEIIVEAYASALGSYDAEIGAITHESYRGRGYAPIAVAYLIEILEQRGYHAYWSCDQDNPASARVARKLGFRVERPYEIHEYEANQ